MGSSTVAVIVTCYNQERYVRQALDSLLAQSRRPDQVVIMDGGSVDRSVRVIEQWLSEHDVEAIFIPLRTNIGLCATLNRAMEEVTSEFVITLYADDWLLPKRIEVQRRALGEAAANVCMAVGDMRIVDRRGAQIWEMRYQDALSQLQSLQPVERVESLVEKNVIPSPAVMLRVEHVRSAGGYDESLSFDDYDLWMRLLGTYDLTHVPVFVTAYREYDSSFSRSKDRRGEFLLSEAKMMAKHTNLTPTINERIMRRLRASSAELVEMDDRSRLAVVVDLMRAVDTHGKIRLLMARQMLRHPGGMAYVKRLGLLSAR